MAVARCKRVSSDAGRRTGSNRCRAAFWLAVCVLAWAPSVCGSTEPALAAAVGFARSQAVFSLAGTSEVTDYTEVGVAFRQWLIRHVFNLGLRGGYLNVTQDSNPAVGGASFAGAFGGLDAELHLALTHGLSLVAYASETYHQAGTHLADGHALRIRWYGFHARIGPLVQIGPLMLGLGAYDRRADGRELTALPSSSLFAHQSGPYASLTLVTGSDGSVELLGEGGRWHTYLLSFRYGF